MSRIDDLILVAQAFCEAKGLSEARVSTMVLKGGWRLAKIRNGGDIGVRTLGRAIRWFSQNWPADTPWPADVPRPAVEGAS